MLVEINFYFANFGFLMAIGYCLFFSDYASVFFSYIETPAGIEFLKMLAISASINVVLNYSMLSAVMIGGPIMTIIIGNLRDILLTYYGLAYQSDESIYTNKLMILGLLLSFGGAIYQFKTKHRLVIQEQ